MGLVIGVIIMLLGILVVGLIMGGEKMRFKIVGRLMIILVATCVTVAVYNVKLLDKVLNKGLELQ